jgi:hypothetical protein
MQFPSKETMRYSVGPLWLRFILVVVTIVIASVVMQGIILWRLVVYVADTTAVFVVSFFQAAWSIVFHGVMMVAQGYLWIGWAARRVWTANFGEEEDDVG